MNKKVIATIRIAPGELGYYDEVSGIRLNQSNPQADIIAGTNCTVLRRSLKAGRILLVSGELDKGRSLREILGLSKKKAFTITELRKEEKVVVETIEDIIPEPVIENEITEEEIAVSEESVEAVPQNKTQTLNSLNISFSEKGEKFELTTDAENAVFESQDTSVVTVAKKKGIVTAKSTGETKIIVTADEYETAEVIVSVNIAE